MFILAHLSDPSCAAAKAQSAGTAVQARARLSQLAAQAAPDPPRRTCWPGWSPISKPARPTTSRSPAISSISRSRSEFATGARLAGTARRSVRPSRVVPGNHDCYVRAAVDLRPAALGAIHAGDDNGNFPFVRRRGPLALIGLSTSLPTPPLAATGRLHGGQLERLGGVLAALRREKAFRVVLIHHPPVEGAHYFRRLRDAEALARRAAAARRGAGAARPSSHLVARLAAGPGIPHSGGGRAVGLGRAGAAPRRSGRLSISMRSTARPATGAARWSSVASTRTTAGSSRSSVSR